MEMLDARADEIADEFRNALADLRRQLAVLDDGRSAPAMVAALRAADRIGARGANLIDLATGWAVAKPR